MRIFRFSFSHCHYAGSYQTSDKCSNPGCYTRMCWPVQWGLEHLQTNGDFSRLLSQRMSIFWRLQLILHLEGLSELVSDIEYRPFNPGFWGERLLQYELRQWWQLWRGFRGLGVWQLFWWPCWTEQHLLDKQICGRSSCRRCFHLARTTFFNRSVHRLATISITWTINPVMDSIWRTNLSATELVWTRLYISAKETVGVHSDRNTLPNVYSTIIKFAAQRLLLELKWLICNASSKVDSMAFTICDTRVMVHLVRWLLLIA